MRRADHDRLVGRTIAGKFVIEDLLGSGAMGAVFRARQISLDKTVAIKVLHGEHASDPQFTSRFQREARAASRLNHPNSMQVLDYGAEPDGLLYIAMEYLDGRSLHAIIRDEWPLGATRTADVLMQTLAALAVAHDMGVVHRDLKPENIMVLTGRDDDGRPKDVVKVCDFGIAKITDPRAYRGGGEQDSEAPLTTAGFLVGTPEYMSPEQGRGEKLDSRSDLYSVGVILFEMLTKRVPFDAENAIGIVLKHITEEPPLPSQLVSGVDPRLEAIGMRALRKFREERYPTAREMRAELRAVADAPALQPGGESPRALVPSRSEPPSVTAATLVAMPVVTRTSEGVSGVDAKPTLEGTTAAVARPPGRRRGVFLVGVTLAALGAGVGGMVWLVRGPSHGTTSAAAFAIPEIPTAVASVLLSTLPPSGKDLSAAAEPPVSTSPVVAAPGGPLVRPVAKSASIAPPGARPARSAPGASERIESPKAAAPIASAPVAPIASASGSVPPPALPAPSAEPATTARAIASSTVASPDPASPPIDAAFDPNRGYVEVGMINVEGVRERAVRGALHGVGLSQCYKAALQARGGRATGLATLNLSFDESGLARSAVVTGAEFLPGLTRCLQEASAGLRVPKAHIDPGGGVAEVTLEFKEP